MFAKLSMLVALVVLPFAAAQDVGIKAIEAHFEGSLIVKDYLKDFNPTALLTLNYAGVGDISPGQPLTIAQVRPVPTVRINSTDPLTGAFTLAMFDVDVPGSAVKEVNRHWLVNGATVADGVVSIASATAITAYAGPGPAAGSGPHRYVVALYQQPATFTAPAGFADPMGVTPMDWLSYASNLGPLVAANYIAVEEGTYTGTAVSTAPVISSTLAPAASSASVSGSKSASGSASKSAASASASGSGAPAAAQNGSATRLSAWAAPVAAFIGGIAVALI
jgi:hypothetical protein